jgi:hypothetical protein
MRGHCGEPCVPPCAFFFLCVGSFRTYSLKGKAAGAIDHTEGDWTAITRSPQARVDRRIWSFHPTRSSPICLPRSARVVRPCMHHPWEVARIGLAKGDSSLTTPFVLAVVVDVSGVPGNRVSYSMAYVLFAPSGDSQGPPLQNRPPDLGQSRLLRASCTNMGDCPRQSPNGVC